MDGMKQQPNTTSEGMLANFFNSLLNKKTGVPSTGGTPRSGMFHVDMVKKFLYKNQQKKQGVYLMIFDDN